jgi:phosphoribosylformylglycinamidine synthase PurS subunit
MAKDTRKSKAKDSKPEPKDALYLARVYVALKPTVNDPEGNTIAGALGSLGFEGVEGVRSGRFFQVRLRAKGPRIAKKAVDQMCSRLLANPVIEAYTFEIAEAK